MAKNSANITVETQNVAKEETKETRVGVNVDVLQVTNKDKRVKIKPKFTFRQYIGNKYWEFKAGEEMLVPEFVKDILQERGALDVL